MDKDRLIQASMTSPLVTRERYAEISGLSLSVLNAQIDKGYWPVVRVGKYSLVNLALIQKACLERQEFNC